MPQGQLTQEQLTQEQLTQEQLTQEQLTQEQLTQEQLAALPAGLAVARQPGRSELPDKGKTNKVYCARNVA